MEFRPHPKPPKTERKGKKPLPKRSKKWKAPTVAQKRRWNRLGELGCCVNNLECKGVTTIHHCFTGAGGVKDHDKTIPLCWTHHLSRDCGIDGRGKYSKITWQAHYGSELYFLEKVNRMLVRDAKI